jgi:hypothetical protein
LFAEPRVKVTVVFEPAVTFNAYTYTLVFVLVDVYTEVQLELEPPCTIDVTESALILPIYSNNVFPAVGVPDKVKVHVVTAVLLPVPALVCLTLVIAIV